MGAGHQLMYGLEGLALHRRRRAKNGSRLHDAVLFSVLVMAASMLSCSFFDRSRQTKSETRKDPVQPKRNGTHRVADLPFSPL